MASYLCAKSGSDGLEYSTITVSSFLLPFLLSRMLTGQLAQNQRIHGSHTGNCLPACTFLCPASFSWGCTFIPQIQG